MVEARGGFQQGAEIQRNGIEPALAFLAAEVQFNEYGQSFARAGGGGVEFFGEAEGVHRVHRGKNLDRFAGLVGLQVANHVEVGAG